MTAHARGPRPLQPDERLPFLDALRGIAILGVLVSYTIWSLGSSPADRWSALDQAIATGADVLVDGKFLTIFAFLFGFGSAQQWRRIEFEGMDPFPAFARRMLFLLVAGLLHGALLRNGDILAPYALMGLVVAAGRNVRSSLLAIGAVGLALLPYVFQAAIAMAGWSSIARPGPEAGNLDWLGYWYLTNPLFSWPRIAAVMLAGVIAERLRLLTRLAWDAAFARRVLGIAAAAAIASRAWLWLLLRIWTPGDSPVWAAVIDQVHHLANWTLAATYVSGLALLWRRAALRDRLWWLQTFGRMALTNYLMQGLLVVPLSLAFGWFDRVTPTGGLALALGIAAVQVPLAVWWHQRVAYGPVEWLWRAVTYGTTRPLGELLPARSMPRPGRAA